MARLQEQCMKASTEVQVDGRSLRLSNLDKVLYPAAGFTKGQVIDYYVRVAPVMLPHLAGRGLTLKRYPNGVESPFFYEKQCPAFRPKWLPVGRVPRRGEKEGPIEYCVINDLASLVWVANLASIELHTPMARIADIGRPTMMVFDLDPGPPAGLLESARVALDVRQVLEEQGLQSWIKTSGGKGLQVYVPLNTPIDFPRTKAFARELAEALERRSPELVTANMRKELRGGKVFIDWSQNDQHKTTVCAYSLRARERPRVSTPIAWDEVQRALRRKDAERLVFEADDVHARIDKLGDLFAPVLKLKQHLPQGLRATPGAAATGRPARSSAAADRTTVPRARRSSARPRTARTRRPSHSSRAQTAATRAPATTKRSR
jgi:bifunctional non-homologous end joining protein LigD